LYVVKTARTGSLTKCMPPELTLVALDVAGLWTGTPHLFKQCLSIILLSFYGTMMSHFIDLRTGSLMKYKLLGPNTGGTPHLAFYIVSDRFSPPLGYSTMRVDF